MEAVLGTASGLVGRVVKQLSDELVDAYVSSTQLSINSENIRRDLSYTQGLLHEARQRGVAGDNPGLQELLQQLTAKADKAEDALDELHYFIIQDELDNTKYAVPDLGNGLFGHCRHIHHVVRHTIGNCLACFSHSCMMQDHDEAAAPPPKLPFDRVAMSKKIKSVIEEIHSICDRVSELLKIIPPHGRNTAIANLRRPLMGSTTSQGTLHGRTELFEKTIKEIITSGPNSSETLSVLPIVGPGGIGKTTFIQHLYNDKRIQEHFSIRVWVCVSTDFDVFKLSQQILSCIPATGNEESNTSNQTTNLDQLQTSIAKRLRSIRFLIVFDDIWECNRDGWENMLAPFMKGGNKGNMVIVTTRFPSIADMVKTTHSIPLKGLEPDDFFTFFEAFIFDGKKPKDYQHELTDVAKKIAKNLKGSPLAAKTVGRLLKKEISEEHWMRVLENNEWQNQKNADDIMPSLRISYDYLPFHLRKCFPYFALFPEDYRFKHLEITHFWIAVGVIDKDENYVEELVDNGFLVKENDRDDQYYVLHDLLHELSQSVSSQECLNISSGLNFRADDIPDSIRHISITMEDKCDGNFRGEMVKLRSKIDTVNLRTLMIYREYGETIDEILKETFKEIEGLRVLFIVVKSPQCFPRYLSSLIHLRYLKLSTSSNITLPRSLSRLYHLILLDLRGGRYVLPNDISRLINIHHFVAEKELISSVPEVGKMKLIHEIKEFQVKKESVGFELSELGELTKLGGKLVIRNLEKVATKEEAMKAKLVSKGDLKELKLVWGESGMLDGTPKLFDVLDGLEPHPNLRSLVIKNHGGSTRPSWLCGDTSLEMLKFLHLEGVSWVTLPPFGQLPHLTSLTLRKIYEVREIGPGLSCGTENGFLQLKQIVLDRLPKLIEWVGAPNAHSFSRLEKISCIECPNLCVLPFLMECYDVSYDHLSEIRILRCPKLYIPPMPHTSALTQVDLSTRYMGKMKMDCTKHELFLQRYRGTFDWPTLAWHNMADKVESVKFELVSKIPWGQLQKLTSLRELEINLALNYLPIAPLSNLTSLTSLKLLDCLNITLDGFNLLINAVNLKTLWVKNMFLPYRSVAKDLLSELVVASKSKLPLPATSCFQLEELSVDSISAVLAAPVCSFFAATLRKLDITCEKQVESFSEEEENALLILTSLESLTIWYCPRLLSLPRRLHELSSLLVLLVGYCPEIRSMPKEGIPASLRELTVTRCNPELMKQAKELQATHPELHVTCY